MITNSQVKTLVKILHKAEELSFQKGKYEIKRYEVDELECGLVSVVLEVGMIKDEGTWASIMCRDKVHLFIGKRGCITCYDKNEKIRRLAPNESLLKVSLA